MAGEEQGKGLGAWGWGRVVCVKQEGCGAPVQGLGRVGVVWGEGDLEAGRWCV